MTEADILLGSDLYDGEHRYRGSYDALVYGGFDHDGDGIGDVAVGNRIVDRESGEPASRGSINVFNGPILESRSADDADVLLSRFGSTCEEAGLTSRCDSVGTCLQSAGDLDGDGYPDLLVGTSWSYTNGYLSNGALYVVPGPLADGSSAGLMDIDEVAVARLDGGYDYASFPDQMQGKGDLNVSDEFPRPGSDCVVDP